MKNQKRDLSEENLTRETIKGPQTSAKTEVQEKRREGHEVKKATKGVHHE